MTLLDVKNLTVRTGNDTVIVSDLSFSIEPGERFGLIGESGSGKSVTTLAIMGLLPTEMSATGRILLDKTSVIGARERALRRLRGRVAAVIFQEPLSALDPVMRLGSQLAIPIARHQHLRGSALVTAVRAALIEVSLPDPERIARSYPHEISGGQLQRVAIAMALACHPTLLIADEPTTALDVTVQAEVLALLDGLVADRGMSLLFVSHDLAVVSTMTDRVVVLREGVAVESGTIASLLTSQKNPYTAALVASARELDHALEVP